MYRKFLNGALGFRAALGVLAGKIANDFLMTQTNVPILGGARHHLLGAGDIPPVARGSAAESAGSASRKEDRNGLTD